MHKLALKNYKSYFFNNTSFIEAICSDQVCSLGHLQPQSQPSEGIHLQTAQDHIKNAYLSSLPPGFMPFEEFEKEFALGNVTTEQLHPLTKHLSQVMHSSIPQGMELLLEVDKKVIEGFEAFTPSIRNLALQIAERMGQRGRIFLVGSGSSGTRCC